METAQLSQLGCLKGHGGWVTALATTYKHPKMLVSASRDKTLIVWNLTPGQALTDGEEADGPSYGYPHKLLAGHSHFVEDVIISQDGNFALSGSWDGTLRLWEIETGKTARVFVGHEKDVLAVAFSSDNTKIVSGSRDKTIKLWNTLGECKFTIEGHTEWVSCVRFSPQPLKVPDPAGGPDVKIPLIVSCGWDKLVKVWNLNSCVLKNNLVGHTGYLNTVTVSPDGSLCASGGKDGNTMLWSLQHGRPLYQLDAGDVIHALVFSPNRYWLCAATLSCIKIWDLETKHVVDELRPDFPPGGKKHVQNPYPISLCWSADGTTLFSGYTDNMIRVWGVGAGAADWSHSM